MIKSLGILALLALGCSPISPVSPKAPAAQIPPGLSFQPQPVPLPTAKPKYIPPPVLLEPEPEESQTPIELPGPKLVAALAVLEKGELLQCTELYGFSSLPFGPPETEIEGLRVVPIGVPCLVQFKDQVVPATCGNKVSEELRKKSNLIWEQNYYFDGLRDDLGKLEESCSENQGAWWDELKGGRYPDFLVVYPSPQQLEMF